MQVEHTLFSERVVGVVRIILELTVTSTSSEDLVLPSCGVQRIEVIFKDKGLSWSVETAPIWHLDVVHPYDELGWASVSGIFVIDSLNTGKCDLIDGASVGLVSMESIVSELRVVYWGFPFMIVPSRVEVLINSEKSLVTDIIIGSLESGDVYELSFCVGVHVLHEPFDLRDHTDMIFLESHSK